MSGIFSTFNTANKGMAASQTALQTIGHNISNAKTEGFSRQRVELQADLAFNFAGVGQVGTGVKMASVVRVVNDYVSKQIRQENSTLNQFDAKSEVLEHLEIIFNEPSDTGLVSNLGKVFASWQELSNNPESLNLKTIVIENSKTLTNTMNHMAKQLNSLTDETIDQIKKSTDDFNSLVDQLDTLNQQIYNISIKGAIPNDLLDQRDLLLNKLSSIADIKVNITEHDKVEIKLGDIEVLSNKSKSILKTDEDGNLSLVNLQDSDDIKSININSGRINGYKEALKDVKARKDDLNNFAKTIADAVNEVHNTNVGDVNFFSYDSDGNIAENIKISQAVEENHNLVKSGEQGAPEGDGSVALKIANLRNKKINGSTIEGSYRDIVTKIGISKEHSDNNVSNQEVLLNQLQLRRESTSGVMIDEEVTNLFQYQKSYEANAKVIAVLAEMLDTLINRMGV